MDNYSICNDEETVSFGTFKLMILICLREIRLVKLKFSTTVNDSKQFL